MTIVPRTNLVLAPDVRRKLEIYAKEKGMNMSSYVSHLIELESVRRENKQVQHELLNTMASALKDPEVLANLIKNRGDQ